MGLHTQAYTVKTLDGWGEQKGRKVGEAPPVFLRDGHGKEVPGAGFFLNTPTVNVDLSPKGLLVSFNPSKIIHPYHLLTDPREVGRIGDDVQRTLKANGVLVDVNAMQTIRVDLAKQCQLKHAPHNYIPALAHLRGKRMTGHQYPDGYSWRNTQREDVFYNKARELYEKQRMTIPESNLGRMEAKWKKGRPLAKDFQFSAFGDLRKADPEHLTTVYRDALNNNVFRIDRNTVQLVLAYDTELSRLQAYLQAHTRNGAFEYLSDMGLTGVDALGGMEAFRTMLLDAGMAGRTVRYTMDKLNSKIQRAAMVNTQRNKEAVNVHTLLEELKQAYAA